MKRDFLSLTNLSAEGIRSLLELAISLKQSGLEAQRAARLKDKVLVMVFQKPSLRTRVSFDVAMFQLGGYAVYLSPDEIKLGERESIPDAARVLSRYGDAIMARVYAHADIITMAQWASVPVINGLSDDYHPCQGLADLLTIYEKLGRLAGVRLAYVGDGNNVLHSLLLGGAAVGLHVVAATPENYEPLTTVVAQAKRVAQETGAKLEIVREPAKAVEGANVIYTDTWTSMGQEAEAEERERAFASYQVNAALLKRADEDVGVMHCLPAHRGKEITDEVMDGPHSWVFDQAENRLHAQKAILTYVLEG
ncbi:MAG: ornithine carbamoyltransferase [Chloroflexota bacterium]|nr:ornithine carbamoyltransferase [Chloroflexota bacterium]